MTTILMREAAQSIGEEPERRGGEFRVRDNAELR